MQAKMAAAPTVHATTIDRSTGVMTGSSGATRT
jgi:hypothetical protein